MPDGDAIADRVNELIDSGDFDLVVATRDWHPPDHGSFREQGGPWPPHCVQGSHGAELHDSLDRDKVDVVVDAGYEPGLEGYSGFEETDLAEVLRSHDVDEVTVVGLATDYCVGDTAPDALREGFRVTDRPRRNPWDRRRTTATRSARSRSCAQPARPWSEPARARIQSMFHWYRLVGRRLRRSASARARRRRRGARAGRAGARGGERRGVPERRRARGRLRRGGRRLRRDRREVDRLGSTWRRHRRRPCSRAMGTCSTRDPEAMARLLDGAPSGRPRRRSATGPPRATLTDVGAINDRAYTFGGDSVLARPDTAAGRRGRTSTS